MCIAFNDGGGGRRLSHDELKTKAGRQGSTISKSVSTCQPSALGRERSGVMPDHIHSSSRRSSDSSDGGLSVGAVEGIV